MVESRVGLLGVHDVERILEGRGVEELRGGRRRLYRGKLDEDKSG